MVVAAAAAMAAAAQLHGPGSAAPRRSSLQLMTPMTLARPGPTPLKATDAASSRHALSCRGRRLRRLAREQRKDAKVVVGGGGGGGESIPRVAEELNSGGRGW